MPNGGPDVADLQVNPTTTDTTKWGKRPDGSAKGNGFLGLLKRPDGSISSELSISTDAVGGKDFPLLVPTLTKDEVKKVLAIKEGDPKFFDKLPPGVVQKAEAYAKQREAQGKPLFAGKDEEPHFGANAPDNAASLSPYQLNLRTIQAEANSLADLQGIRDPDLRNAFIKDQMSTAYVGALAHMVEGGKNLNGEKLKVAQNYFDSIKDNLSAKQQDTIQSVLKAGALQDTVLSYSDKLMDSHKGERAQRQQIRADFEAGKISGQEREHIESRISHLNAQAREQDGQHTASIVGQAQDFFIKNPGATITDLPTVLYTQLMNKGQLASIDGFSKREANHTDPATLQRVQTHFNDGSPDDIMKMSDTDFLNLHGRLSNSDWKYWGTQRDNANKGIFSPRTDAGSVQEGVFNTSLKTRLSAIGIDVKSMKGEEDRARLGGLQQFAKEWIIADQTAAGHKFNDEQLGRSLDRLMATNAEFRTTFIGFDTGSGAMPLMKMGYGDLPSDAREGIKKALIKNGNPNPTKQDILNAYWRIHGTR